MSKVIWTPDRDVLVDDVRRAVTQIRPQEMKIIEAMHIVAQRHAIVLACTRCRQPFQGLNDGVGTTQVVSCGCRELRAVVPRSALITTP